MRRGAAVCAILAWLAAYGGAADDAAPVVVDLRIEGLRHLSDAYVRSRIETRVGLPLHRSRLQEDIRRLHEEGAVLSVRVEEVSATGGVVLVFRIEEAPWLREWSIETDLRHRKRLRRLLRHVSGADVPRDARGRSRPLSVAELERDLVEIRRFLTRKGYYGISVEAERSEEDGEVDLVIRVGAEGSRRVTRIEILGEPLSHGRHLRKLARSRTRPRAPFVPGRFDPEIWAQDVRQMEIALRREGWLDATVEALPPEVVRGRWLRLPLRVERGPRYRLGTVSFGTDAFTPQVLRDRLRMREGDPYRADGIEEGMRALQAWYSDHGRFLEDVTILPRYDLEGAVVHLQIVLQEGEPFSVDEIEFVGNRFTRDRVLRREMRIRPGEPFHHAKVEESVRRLHGLRYFEDVRWELGPVEPGRRRDLIVEVDETPEGDKIQAFGTGNFNLGGSYSEELGAQLQMSWTERNFNLGRFAKWPYCKGDGQQITISASPGSRYDSFRVDFNEPWFLNLPVGIGVGGFLTDREYSDYSQGSRGASVSASRRWEMARHGDRYRRPVILALGIEARSEQIRIHAIESDAPSAIQEQRGQTNVNSLRPFLRLDGRDDPYTPTRGFFAQASHEYAGDFLGGEDFWKTTATAQVFVPVRENRHGNWHVLSLGTRAGWAQTHSGQDALPVSERFFAGGTASVRGFEVRTIGPKEGTRSVGGSYLWLGRAEYEFPLGSQRILRGSAFYDAGTVERSTGGDLWDEVRSSWGFGARVAVPVLGPVPIQFDWAWPIRKEEGDEGDSFTFSLGSTF